MLTFFTPFWRKSVKEKYIHVYAHNILHVMFVCVCARAWEYHVADVIEAFVSEQLYRTGILEPLQLWAIIWQNTQTEKYFLLAVSSVCDRTFISEIRGWILNAVYIRGKQKNWTIWSNTSMLNSLLKICGQYFLFSFTQDVGNTSATGTAKTALFYWTESKNEPCKRARNYLYNPFCVLSILYFQLLNASLIHNGTSSVWKHRCNYGFIVYGVCCLVINRLNWHTDNIIIANI